MSPNITRSSFQNFLYFLNWIIITSNKKIVRMECLISSKITTQCRKVPIWIEKNNAFPGLNIAPAKVNKPITDQISGQSTSRSDGVRKVRKVVESHSSLICWYSLTINCSWC
jgi:hypothetical protein